MPPTLRSVSSVSTVGAAVTAPVPSTATSGRESSKVTCVPPPSYQLAVPSSQTPETSDGLSPAGPSPSQVRKRGPVSLIGVQLRNWSPALPPTPGTTVNAPAAYVGLATSK